MKAKYHEDSIVFRKVADYMYASKFLTPEFCRFIINKCEALDNWGSASDSEEYLTQDVYLQQELPNIFRVINSCFNSLVKPAIDEAMPCEMNEAYSMFVVKYSPETQKTLGLHRDASHITATVKLNDSYIGGDLIFPEQDFSPKDLEVGEVLLWPASITHPHRVEELKKGTKYSLVIWTDFPCVDGDADTETKRQTF